MKSTSKVFLSIICLGLLGMIGFKYLQPIAADYTNKKTSDAQSIKATLKIGVDSWIGYYPLCSKDFKSRMRANGYLIQCVDDSADYQTRFKKLKSKEYHFAVSTVDAYLLNGASYDFPGTIVAVIDESKGGDAMISNRSDIKNLDDLKGMPSLSIAYTPDSPSEHLLNSAAVHFDITSVLQKQHKSIETQGAEQAYQALVDKKSDVAILWEPYVSQALKKPNHTLLLSTKDTRNLIVDILLVNREFSAKDKHAVNVLLRNYFRTLKHYRDNDTLFIKEIADTLELPLDQVKLMMQGVSWQTLHSNATQWFGLDNGAGSSRENIIDSIDSSIDVMKESNKISSSPIPDANPYLILNRSFIQAMFEQGLFSAETNNGDGHAFAELSDQAWSQLAQVGTLKIRPIQFQSGTADLTEGAIAEIDTALKHLQHYPNFRVLIKGHTNLKGDPEANMVLSLGRAQAIRRAILEKDNDINPHRIKAIGLGLQEPLPRKLGESNRAYQYRLPRVEFFLMSEVY